jgi:phosphoribosylaminoimidazole-succinocarboxamide synthase
MEKLNLIYEGKAKQVYATAEPDLCVLAYKDDATAFNGEKKGTIPGKGALNNRISNFFMELLESKGVATHLVRPLNDRETLVRRVEIVPLEVIVRNLAAGSLCTRLGLAEGLALPAPVVEFCYKADALGDPLVNKSHILALGLALPVEIRILRKTALRVNQILFEFLSAKDVVLVDFKLEFGRYKKALLLADEISPDTCRFWDRASQEKLDKDRFRRDLPEVGRGYGEMARRLGLDPGRL